MNKTVLIHTLGCRLNSADTALLTSRLAEAGYTPVKEGSADLIVVNSCTVTAEAARKSRQAVRKFRAASPDAVIIVTGCGAESDREAFLADKAASAVITNPEKRQIVPLILEYLNSRDTASVGGRAKSLTENAEPFFENTFSSFPFRSRAFIKIQEGCNNCCSYCIVPYTRGHERSRDFAECIADCRRAVEAGFPEIVLTGVNTCAYSDHGKVLEDLIREIAAIEGDFRIRLSSTEPAPDNLGLLDVMASEPKVCRFLHLALQHGCDRILQKMNRHYTRDIYAHFVRSARERIPDIHIGSDLIVGFPGETEEDFADSCNFIRQIAFANLHIFTYSKRPGTPAAEMPDQVPGNTAQERYRLLKQIADVSHREFLRSNVGKTLPVIFERVGKDGFARGWSDNYIEVRRPAVEVPLDRIVPIVIKPEDFTGSQEVLN
ncbi:MAG: tRNA (N(6)-L-threonylcarbamoyladenosine(37)-C(2))-methylthiotransferase MtaB [Lentisphaeria bacterium]|nr:tRNA (N(6)-L-threonylcarbamoyladenosine(37)-C(2))-methylthiotransferase MtaB [Lentisphaeria bacterium]